MMPDLTSTELQSLVALIASYRYGTPDYRKKLRTAVTWLSSELDAFDKGETK